uniref:Uncharacterized protein n=1 Tax=Meloidogyne enterolobii TaxID=390850 RepID=A0A6V7TL62_MELEN|nr:unnamed protein product [Meloidogyne enterolobii]
MTKPKEMSKLTTPFTSQIPFLLTFPPNGHRTAKTMKSVHSAHFTSYIYSLFLFLSQKLSSLLFILSFIYSSPLIISPSY